MAFFGMMMSQKVRLVKTIAIYLAFINVGLCTGIIGPTLLDLQLGANTTLEKIAYLLPSRSGGYAIGSFFIGLIFSLVNPLLVVSVCLFTGLFFGSIPWLRSLSSMVGVLFATGTTFGMIDSCGNMFILHMWGKDSPPFMQALHFAFGFGSFVAPLIAKPFLLPLNPEDNANNGSNFTSEISNSTEHRMYTADDLLIQWPFLGISTVLGVSSLVFTYLYIRYPNTPEHPSRTAAKEDEDGGRVQASLGIKILTVLVTCLFLHLHCGLVIAYGSLITTYVVNCPLHLTKATGALMSALFWGTFTFMRVLCVFYINYIGPEMNVIINLGICSLACVFLVPFGGSSETCLWIGIALMGIGTSSIWAAIYAYLENFFPVTSRIAATFTVSACLGEFVLPSIMGTFVEECPSVFLWTTLVSTVADLFLFALMYYLLHKYFTAHPKGVDEKRIEYVSPDVIKY